MNEAAWRRVRPRDKAVVNPPPAFLNSEMMIMRSLSRSLMLAALAAGLTLGTVAVQAQDAPPPPPPGDRGPDGPGGPGPRGLPPEILAKYDANKDGKLDQAERTAMRVDEFKAMDKSGKGKISKADFPAAIEAARDAKRAEREAALFDKMDANKDGFVTAEEFANFKPERPNRDDRKEHKRP
jgi:hypothetical protein